MSSSLGRTVGVVEIGVLLSAVIYGLTTAQVYMYYKGGYKDGPRIHILIWFLWTLETLTTVFSWHYLYTATILSTGPLRAMTITWSLQAVSFVSIIITVTVQAYFAYRLWILSYWRALSILSWIGSLAIFALSVLNLVVSNSLSLIEFTARFLWLAWTVLALTVVVDVINTSGLCLSLWQARKISRTTLPVIDRIMVWTVETGLITALGALITVILEATLTGSEAWLLVTLILVRIYTNSFLASLNGRSTLRALEMHRQWKSSGPLSFADGPLSTFHAQAPSDGKLEAPSSSGLSPSDVSAKDSDSGPFRLKDRTKGGQESFNNDVEIEFAHVTSTMLSSATRPTHTLADSDADAMV